MPFPLSFRLVLSCFFCVFVVPCALVVYVALWFVWLGTVLTEQGEVVVPMLICRTGRMYISAIILKKRKKEEKKGKHHIGASLLGAILPQICDLDFNIRNISLLLK